MTNMVALPTPANSITARSPIAMALEGLRLLLLRAAEAMGAGDASEVSRLCDEVANSEVNLRPPFGELFTGCNGSSLIEVEQQRRRVLLPLLEARAFYLAALRRWRRNLCMRRSLMRAQRETLADDDADGSRWY